MTNINKGKINWTIACVKEFAKAKDLSVKSACQYLYKFGGVAFLKEHYDAEHLLSFDEAVDDLEQICRRNGGNV